MTTEEKAKAYDEALERAKDCLTNKKFKDIDDTPEDLTTYIFPQLAESEDERIRKAIIELIHRTPSSAFESSAEFGFVGATHDEMLAYLEKLKDHFRDDTKMVERKPNIEIYPHSTKSKSYKEQKSDCLHPEDYPMTPEECTKPTEWSEEDEEMLKFLILNIGRHSYFGGKSSELILSWLKSLRPQSHKEIYQAAKHDLAIKFMSYLDENRPESKRCLSNGECEDIDKAFKENDWAKIIRYIEKYKPHWKPNKEQMEALNALLCVGDFSYVGQATKLQELYIELKKLM